MVAVLQNHLFYIFAGLCFPIFIANVLPAWNLSEYQKTKTVTLVDEVLALGIMGGADSYAAQFFFQDSGILPLQALWGGIANVGIALMAVQTPQEGLFAVEIEPVFLKFNGTDAEFYLLSIADFAVSIQQLTF